MENKKYYLGLDIGTNSVGWAVTNERYELRKYKKNLMWGVHLFDEASPAADRRVFRSARRRINRRKQRISMLQDFFAGEILKIDEKFFLRLKESALLPEDCEGRTHNIYFDDKNFTDKDYYKKYPTIHHLICELMNDNKPHDIRLVYLACSYLLGHRGHFLFSVDTENVESITAFKDIYGEFYKVLREADENIPFDKDENKAIFEDILKNGMSATMKEKQFKENVFGGKFPKPNEELSFRYDKLFKLISGGTAKLSEIFGKDDYRSLEKDSVCVKNADFTETLEQLVGQLEPEHLELVTRIKAMYDWSLLVDILKGHTMISEAKVEVYDIHKKDLEDLKRIVKTYLPHEDYNRIFKDVKEKNNYVSYVKNPDQKMLTAAKYDKCKNHDDFCKYIKKYLERIMPSDEDRYIYERLSKKCDDNTLCPKQVTTDNRVIPYQLYYVELKKILEKASEYLSFLNEKDNYGTVAEKILMIMKFRIPYYVGPLVGSDRSDNAWLHRKAEGKITPWNFDDMVDKDKTENEFIRRMTCKCTYIAGEDVLPENSLLYNRFKVLNEINKITVDGNVIPVDIKQKIFYALFVEKKGKATKKKIKDYLKTVGMANDESVISGIDDTVKSTLKSYHDFRKMLENGILTEYEAEDVISRITISTDKPRLKKWLKEKYPKLSEADVKYILTLKYNDYGRLSRRLLEEIYLIDKETGEVLTERNIITMLWETNDNLMQLLSAKYTFSDEIKEINDEFYQRSENKKTVAERLEEMYISTSVRRSVMRTLEIVSELRRIMKKAPDRIFIEMARGDDENRKGKRTDSRKQQIEKLLEQIDENTDSLKRELNGMDDDRLRSEKYYLYFMQLGQCMYTGKRIDINDLEDNHKWNIDHIWPQAKIKDDSIDNKVLVSSEANGKKGDMYPLNMVDSSWQSKMRPVWDKLRKNNNISEKKYNRLTRTKVFSEDELSGFIARQLVEARQSTKAVAQLLKELCPDSRIVYVKSGLVSDFRHEMGMLKCREINDLHHAKDAYLNIVVGNVFDARFTQNPLNFVRENKNYSIKLFKKDVNGKKSGVMNHRVVRGDEIAWDPDTYFNVVEKMMAKNSIRYVRYTYKRNGGFFNQLPERRKEGLVPRKKGLDPAKYGGYNNTMATHFAIVKCARESVVVIPVEALYREKFASDLEFARKYAANQLSEILLEEITDTMVSFPLGKRVIKINTMLEIDGFRCNIVQKSNKGRTLVIASANSLITDANVYNYIKKITGYVEKSEKGKRFMVNNRIGITNEKNIALYDVLCQKLVSTPFDVMFLKIGQKVINGREKFLNKTVTEQTLTLFNIVHLLKTGRSTGCNLKSIEESGQAGVLTLNSDFSKLKNKKTIYIIDQSVTGLYEKKSPNLLEL